MLLGMELGLGPGHIVLDGDLASPLQRGTAPNFRPISVVAKWLDGLRCPGDFVLDGDPAPPPPKGHSPQFSAHICCGQMAAWIKMSHGVELGFGPGHIVLDAVSYTHLTLPTIYSV